MKSRIDLMHRIAELDIELSKAAGAISPRQKRSFLSRCTHLHKDAEGHDAHIIGQAIHWLIRKHRLHPERPDNLSPGR